MRLDTDQRLCVLTRIANSDELGHPFSPVASVRKRVDWVRVGDVETFCTFKLHDLELVEREVFSLRDLQLD